MKETFKMNSHIYKNATASMQPWHFRLGLSFERRLYELPFNVIHARKKSENPASKDNPPCKNQIVNLVILV